jgi:hypothetical protein
MSAKHSRKRKSNVKNYLDRLNAKKKKKEKRLKKGIYLKT